MGHRPGKARLRRKVGLIPGLPITIEQPTNCGAEQQAVISLLVGAIYVNLTPQVNYDHVRLNFPKAELPLYYRKHRYDIAALVADRVILVDVVSVNPRYWLSGKDGEHGEAKE